MSIVFYLKTREKENKRGPGNTQAVFGSVEDANEAKAILEEDLPEDQEAFVKERQETPIMTLEEWKEQRQSQVARNKQRQDILNKLSPEEIEMLKDTDIKELTG